MQNRSFFIALFVVLQLFLVHFAHASEKKFIFPSNCIHGVNCWAVNYVDMDAAEGTVRDFKCGPKSYDGHKGTDFALSSVRQMNKGVDVFAAAPGRVLRVRDGESDHLKTAEELAYIEENKKECGNGILIDHGHGLQTFYCHLKKDSVVVKPKQKVKAGEKIAEIGQSGMAEFPHLHFGVHWEGGVVDPYTGVLNTDGCGEMKSRMWKDGFNLDYEPVVIFDGGFRAKSPDFEAIKRGEDNPLTIALNSAAFVFWVGFYNVEQGDTVVLRVTDPEGAMFVERKEILEKTRARQYYYTGRKIGRVQLKKGEYVGSVSIERAGDNPVSKQKKFTVMVQ